MAGLWLLVAEHLRLGTWDLLRAWTQQPAERIEPRLALQLVHEAALCSNGLRAGRCLTLRGFETLNGLPFLAEDTTVHEVLGGASVAHTQELQVALGKLRRASGHYQGKLLLIDPHRAPSYSQRHMAAPEGERLPAHQDGADLLLPGWRQRAAAVFHGGQFRPDREPGDA